MRLVHVDIIRSVHTVALLRMQTRGRRKEARRRPSASRIPIRSFHEATLPVHTPRSCRARPQRRYPQYLLEYGRSTSLVGPAPSALMYYWCTGGHKTRFCSSCCPIFTWRSLLYGSGAEGIRTSDLRRAKAALPRERLSLTRSVRRSWEVRRDTRWQRYLERTGGACPFIRPRKRNSP